MGALQSRFLNFQSDYAAYQACVDSIESEHPIQVHRKLKDVKLTSEKQMEVVAIIIYEKAVLNAKVSLKCAQLVKELESERLNGKPVFSSVFNEYLMNLIHQIIDIYDDSKMSDYAVQRGKSIAFFIGNLFVVDALLITSLTEIGQAAKRKETKNNKFFIQTIWSTVAETIMTRHKITFEEFDGMITDSFDIRGRNNSNNPDYNAAARFCAYLEKISGSNRYEFYEHFEDFRHIQDDILKIAVTSFLGHAVKKFDFVNVYRDLALEIYYMRPEETRECITNFMIENIERYQATVNLGIEEHDNLASVIIEFYNTGLITDEIFEGFMKVSKSPRVPIELFNYAFVEVLPKYRGHLVQNFLKHSKTFTKDPTVRRNIIPVIEEYIQGREMETKRRSITNPCERVVADLPDFREYSSKSITLKEAFDPKCSKFQGVFSCENRKSCHFASLKGMEILKKHIGNKFFTPERIDICTKLTAKFLKFQIESSVGDAMCRETKTYLPYTQGNIKLTQKVRNFSNLLASFYNAKLINRDIVINWFIQITEGLNNDASNFRRNFKEIFTEFFLKVSKLLESENSYTWKIYSNMMDSLEFESCSFTDFNHFKDICSGINPELNVVDLTNLKMITIPNEKAAMILISKHLLHLYSNDKISGPALVPIISMLPTLTKHEFDKNLLRSEFQDALCITLGHSCATCKTYGDESFDKAVALIDLVESLCMKTFMTRLGLANLLRVIVDIVDINPYPVPDLMDYFNDKLGQFFLGAKPLPTKVEKIIFDVIQKIQKALKIPNINVLGIYGIIKCLQEILDKNKQMKEQNENKKSTSNGEQKPDKSNILTELTSVKESAISKPASQKKEVIAKKQKQQDQKEQTISNSKDLRDSSSSPPASETSECEVNLAPSSSRSLTNPSNLNEPFSSMPSSEIVQTARNKPQTNNEPSTSTFDLQENPAAQNEPKDQQSTTIQPKMSPDDIKDYQDYCNYYDSIKNKSSDDDKFFFDPLLISTIKITKKEQIVDLAKKFIERVLAGQSTVIFFIQNTQKLGNAIQNIFKLKNQKVSFQKILVDEIFLKFENQELLVQFMCELYNSSFVNRASMIAFVDKFKSLSPENLVLMHTFVRTCAIRLSSQGDKEQLNQIRTIARSVKNLSNYDEDLKYLAQDLANSTNSLIQLLENGQNKPQVLTESSEKLIDDLLKNVLKNPQIYVKSASKLDGNLKDLLIQKIKNFIKEVPKFVIKPDEFINLIEFVAELYNLDFLKNEVLTWTIEILMQSSTNEICSQSIKILFTKCGQKMENLMKQKFDIYMKFFEAVLAEESSSTRSECFRRIQKLRNRKWKVLKIPNNFYEDFLMLFSMKVAKVEELVDILSCDEEEMDKFILVLWKIILKDPPHPSYSILCEELSKICENFHPKLTHFLTTRCITFIGFSADMFNENVKERLGKVMTFVAEIYNNNLASDEVLEMYLDQKLTSKLPSEFVTRIFSILSKCRRLVDSQNDRLKTLVKNFDDIYYQGRSAQIESIIQGLNSISKSGN